MDTQNHIQASLTPAQQRIAARMSEADLQDSTVALALALGYLVVHAHDSRQQALEGMPDLILAGPLHAPCVLWIELKGRTGALTTSRLVRTADGRGRMTVGQDEWRDRLLAAGQRWYLWRPSDWLDGTIERVLKKEESNVLS